MPEVVGTFQTPRLPAAPSTPSPGQIYYDTGLNKLLWWDSTQWVVPTKTFRTGHTWAIPGLLTAITLPPIFVPEASLQATAVVGARAKIGSGTNITAQVQNNGTNLGSSFAVTTTATTTAFSQLLANADQLGIVLSAPTGSPTDLSLTLFLEHIV